MTINGWIQIALYCVIVILLVKPFGVYMTRVFNGERTFLSPVLRPVERVIYRVCGVDERQEQHWVDLCRRHAVLQHRGLRRRSMRCSACRPCCRSIPQGQVGRRAEPRLQHLGELRHQHQLAVLRARDDDELSDPDGRAHRA